MENFDSGESMLAAKLLPFLLHLKEEVSRRKFDKLF